MSEQRFDLALTERADAPSGCRAEVLADLDEVAVLPAGHALASRARLALSDFADQPFVSLADDDPYRAEIDQLFEQAAVGRRMRLQTHSAVAVCALVAQGLGVAVVNPLTALACASERLVVRPLNVRIPFRVTLLTPLHRPVHRVAAPLADALRAQLRSMTA